MNLLLFKRFMGSYIGTYTYAVLNIFTMLLMTAVFSRYWSSVEFLEFTTILRYMGLVTTMASFSLGFSIITKTGDYSLQYEIYPVVFLSVFASSLFLGILFTTLSNSPAFLIIWMVSTSIFHIYISSIRSQSPVEANLISILLKIIFIIFVVSICVFLHLNLFSYYYIHGFLTLIYIIWSSLKHNYQITPHFYSLEVAKVLYKHSFSRVVDNFARLSYHVVPIWVANLLLSDASAGLIALTLIITKTFESSVQPVVLHIHSNRVKNKANLNTNKLLIVILVGTIITILGNVFLNYFGVIAITTWITKEYIVILEYMHTVIWSIPCVILLQIMRSEMESKVSTSPFVYINLLSVVVLIIMSICFSDSINTLLQAYVGVYFLRAAASFFLYASYEKKQLMQKKICSNDDYETSNEP